MCSPISRTATEESKVQYANHRSSGESNINLKIHLLRVNHNLYLYPEKSFPFSLLEGHFIRVDSNLVSWRGKTVYHI